MENEIVIIDLVKHFGDLYARLLPKIVRKKPSNGAETG